MIIDGEEYVYVYRAEESGETAIYLLDRSGSTDELIKDLYDLYGGGGRRSSLRFLRR